jgi:hypothetical protein
MTSDAAAKAVRWSRIELRHVRRTALKLAGSLLMVKVTDPARSTKASRVRSMSKVERAETASGNVENAMERIKGVAVVWPDSNVTWDFEPLAEEQGMPEWEKLWTREEMRCQA